MVPRCAQMPERKEPKLSKRSGGPKTTNGRRRFDPAVFLETAAKGRVISAHPKKQIIFAQGDTADAVFYIRKGKVKVTVVSTQGKEAVVAIPETLVGRAKDGVATVSLWSEAKKRKSSLN